MFPSHILTMPGAMLKRGFWLYVWRITTDNGDVYYVGRTGDSSSPNAAPPYQRMAQHLGFNERINALRRNLEKASIAPEQCSFELISVGPIFDEESNIDAHKWPRDAMAALEKKLACSMKAAGYDVINTVHSRKILDEKLWGRLKCAFAEHFPKLKTVR